MKFNCNIPAVIADINKSREERLAGFKAGLIADERLILNLWDAIPLASKNFILIEFPKEPVALRVWKHTRKHGKPTLEELEAIAANYASELLSSPLWVRHNDLPWFHKRRRIFTLHAHERKGDFPLRKVTGRKFGFPVKLETVIEVEKSVSALGWTLCAEADKVWEKVFSRSASLDTWWNFTHE